MAAAWGLLADLGVAAIIDEGGRGQAAGAAAVTGHLPGAGRAEPGGGSLLQALEITRTGGAPRRRTGSPRSRSRRWITAGFPRVVARRPRLRALRRRAVSGHAVHPDRRDQPQHRRRALEFRPAQECRYDLVALGEVMLRLDPGNGRVATTRNFSASEGGGEYNVARGLKIKGASSRHTCTGGNTTVSSGPPETRSTSPSAASACEGRSAAPTAGIRPRPR